MLLNRNDDPQFRAGLFLDFKNDSAPLFVDGKNVRFTTGSVRAAPSLLPFAKVAQDPVTRLWSQLVHSKNSVFFQVGFEVFELRDNVVTKRFTALGPAQFASFGNFTLLADGGTLAIKKLANGDFERIPGGPLATFVIVFTPFVLVFHDRAFAWSDIDNPDYWGPSGAAHQANSLPIRDMDSPIRSVIRAFNGILVGSDKNQWLVNFLGAPNWFGVKSLDLDVGAHTNESLCLVKSRVMGLGPRGLWITDGFTYEFVDQPAVQDTLFKRVGFAPDVVLANDYYNERVLIISTPREGPRSAVVWDYQNNNFSQTDDKFTAVDRGGSYPLLLFGTIQGWIYSRSAEPLPPLRNASVGLHFKTTLVVKYGYGGLPYGEGGYGQTSFVVQPTEIPAGGSFVITTIRPGQDDTQSGGVGNEQDNEVFLETKEQDFGTTDEKYLDCIIFKISDREQGGDFEYDYATKFSLTEDENWIGWQPFRPDLPVWPRETFRYIKLRIRNRNARAQWQLTGIEYYGEVIGGRVGKQ